ncbi:hypothetical protein DXG01_002280 [Tephrocybe rancida]|nr:hypothetical protein DXG01_002280 [Tephrocybe rancida]
MQYTCIHCEKTCITQSGLNYHARTCKATRKRVGSVLENLKDVWRLKRHRLNPAQEAEPVPSAIHTALASSRVSVQLDTESSNEPEIAQLAVIVALPSPDDEVIPHARHIPDLLISSYLLPEQSTCCTYRNPNTKPKFKPQSKANSCLQTPRPFARLQAQCTLPLTVPMLQAVPPLEETPANAEMIAGPCDLPFVKPVEKAFGAFTSQANVFGLSRIYYGEEPPVHGLEEFISLGDLDESIPESSSISAPALPSLPSPYFPYPNKNSFALGKWFWNPRMQKSQKSFNELLQIVGSDDFSPKVVQNTCWRTINRILGQNDFDKNDSLEWEDEDAGWKRTPITLEIPFHKHMKTRVTQQRLVRHLYHRSIISVIKENLANTHDNQRFHYEPFELLWCPAPGQESHSFGNSKLWPSYIYFGNESKYNRCKPSLNLANHIAYFEALPNLFKDFASTHVGGKGPNKVFLAHCNREMYHEQWRMVLDDEFVLAYKHGIVVKFLDSVLRRFYPRILTYSADYPEKVLLASIRNRGSRPCPQCTITKADLKNMGGICDMSARLRCACIDDALQRGKVTRARQYIYEEDFGINSKPVEDLLKDLSFVPVSLAPFGFNFFQMLVVDILHDWEIGAWKAIFVHLIRILHTSDVGLVNELDACLAKLRMHSDLSLTELDEATKELGSCLRTSFQTQELPQEAEARTRRMTKGKKNAPQTSTVSGLSTCHAKALNLDTYNFHALGDVMGHIREFGTTDSYSTEIGELEHRTVKAQYSRTDRKEFTRQIARIEHHEARVSCISRNTSNSAASFEDDLTVKWANGPEIHHFIGKTENLPVHIGQHVNEHFGDPAVQDFIPQLKKHLLPRIRAIIIREATPDEAAPCFSNDSNGWQSVLLRQDRMYRHNIMRVHYTSYDIRHNADMIHVNTTHCNVMVLNPDFDDNPELEHPYLYAKVLGIYHANFVYLGADLDHADHHPRRIEFLWVRWYTFEGHGPKRLPRLSFPSVADEYSFGFIDPNNVLRGSHLTPGFSRGNVDQPSGQHCVRASAWAKEDKDWQFYYVDMFMQYYWGMGVGHIQVQGAYLSSYSRNGSELPEEPNASTEDDLGDQELSSNDVTSALDEQREPLNIEGDPDAPDDDDLDEDDMVFNKSDSESNASSVEGGDGLDDGLEDSDDQW